MKGEIYNACKRLDDMDYPISRGDTLFTFVYALLRWNGAVSFPSMHAAHAQPVAASFFSICLICLSKRHLSRVAAPKPFAVEHYRCP